MQRFVQKINLEISSSPIDIYSPAISISLKALVMKKKHWILFLRIFLVLSIVLAGAATWYFLQQTDESIAGKLTDSDRIQKIGWYAQDIQQAEERLQQIAKDRISNNLRRDEAIKKIESGQRTVNTEDWVSPVADHRNNVISREKLREASQVMIDEGTREKAHYDKRLSELNQEERELRQKVASHRERLSHFSSLKTWTNHDGRSLNAYIIGTRQNQVDVVTADGRLFTLNSEQLVTEDRAYATLFQLGFCPEKDLLRAFQEGHVFAISLYQEAWGNELADNLRQHPKLSRALSQGPESEPAIQILRAVAAGTAPKRRSAEQPDSVYYVTPDNEQEVLVRYFR